MVHKKRGVLFYSDNKQIKCNLCKSDLDIEDKVCPYCNKLVGDTHEDY